MIQIKLIYKIMPKYITTLIFPQYGIQSLFLTKYKNKKRIVASIVSIILIFTFICLQSKVILKKGSIEGNIIDISLANDSYMANYLGYFFVALSLSKDWVILGVVYAIVFVFTYKSQSLFYNPLFLLFGYNFYYIHDQEGMKVFVISKKKDIRSCENLSFSRVRKVNDFTFIDEER